MNDPMSKKDRFQIPWTRAKNSTIFLGNGKEYIDFTSGVILANVGHGHTNIIKRIQARLYDPLLHCYKYPFPDKTLLSEKLLALTNRSFAELCYCVSGTEAIETALRICNRVNPNKTIISFTDGFHGKSLGAGTISDAFRHQLPEWAQHANWVKIVSFPSDGMISQRVLEFLEKEKGNVSGIVIECIQGSSLKKIDVAFLKKAAQICTRNDIVLIIDEIQTGFYRLGLPFAYMEYDIQPNMICIGKGLTSSLPLAAVLFDSTTAPFYKADIDCSTHAANPLSVAAALACVEIYGAKKFQNHLSSVQVEYTAQMKSLGDLLLPAIVHCYYGTLFGGLIFPKSMASVADDFVSRCMDRGLFIARPVGKWKNIVKFVPPLSIERQELTKGFSIAREAARASGILTEKSQKFAKS